MNTHSFVKRAGTLAVIGAAAIAPATASARTAPTLIAGKLTLNTGVIAGFNPQPEPPGVTFTLTPQPALPGVTDLGSLIAFNPQPEPPGVTFNLLGLRVVVGSPAAPTTAPDEHPVVTAPDSSAP